MRLALSPAVAARLLSQVISSPGLHTAVLLTPNGQLVSYACDSTRSKDDVRLVVGLSSEIWLEVADQGIGMVDSELGRILVLGVQDAVATTHPHPGNSSRANSANTDHASDKPLMLVALSATEAVGWEDLEAKGRELTEHLSSPVSRLRKPLAAASTSTPSPPATRHGR